MDSFPISGGLYYSEPGEYDVPALVALLNDRDIYDNTLLIPFPYTEADAFWFINHCRERKAELGHALNFAIRNADGLLLGLAGFHGKNNFPAGAHKDEFGYWIGRPYWNQGIMTAAIPPLIHYGRTVRGLSRFEAMVFEHNQASERVLLKCGFSCEGTLRNVYRKNGTYITAKLMALVDPVQ